MNSRVYDLGWKLTMKTYHVKVQREKYTIIFRKYKYLQYFIWKYAILRDFDFDIILLHPNFQKILTETGLIFMKAQLKCTSLIIVIFKK